VYHGQSHFYPGWKASIIVWCLPEIEGDTLASPPTRARHTLFSLLSMIMIMIETVKRVLGQSDGELVVVCRLCGSKMAPDAESCPVCDSSEIAHYDISR